MEIARLRKGEVTFYNIDREEIEKEPTEIKWDAEAAEKGGFEHFMIKEIHEQPRAVQDTINSAVHDGKIDLFRKWASPTTKSGRFPRSTSSPAVPPTTSGVATQYVMEDLARIPVRVDLASEFRYRRPLIDKDALVIIVSQSGETADSLAALRGGQEHGASGPSASSTSSARPSPGRPTTFSTPSPARKSPSPPPRPIRPS